LIQVRTKPHRARAPAKPLTYKEAARLLGETVRYLRARCEWSQDTLDAKLRGDDDAPALVAVRPNRRRRRPRRGSETSKLESGRANPTFRRLVRLARVFGVPLGALFTPPSQWPVTPDEWHRDHYRDEEQRTRAAATR
jgi:transcriptional regulator with XRE-family HTH domain